MLRPGSPDQAVHEHSHRVHLIRDLETRGRDQHGARGDLPEKGEEHAKGEKKAHKRERLIINPEFVASLDQGDGAQEFDDDYYNNQV